MGIDKKVAAQRKNALATRVGKGATRQHHSMRSTSANGASPLSRARPSIRGQAPNTEAQKHPVMKKEHPGEQSEDEENDSDSEKEEEESEDGDEDGDEVENENPHDIMVNVDEYNDLLQPTISDPSTISGQQLGAYLIAKRIPKNYLWLQKDASRSFYLVVGDVCKILSTHTYWDREIQQNVSTYTVNNVRTGEELSNLPWCTFLEVGIRELCDCPGQKCRCVYEDYEKSKKFAQGN